MGFLFSWQLCLIATQTWTGRNAFLRSLNFKNNACVRKEENLVDTKLGRAVGMRFWREDMIPDKLGTKQLGEEGMKLPDEALPES